MADENREPLRATVKLVEFDDGPGLRIDVIIPWERLTGLARSIRYWRVKLNTHKEIENVQQVP